MNAGPRRIHAWLRKPERAFVLGHRGARRRAPENTLAAFDLAMEEGADGVELDVRLDVDGDVVVIHDSSLDRVTGGMDRRAVETLRRRDLDAVDLGGNEHVPRLANVFEWARGRGARVNVELKSGVTRRARFVLSVARLVAAQPKAPEWILFSSFDPRLLLAMALLVPSVPAGWLVEARHPLPSRVQGQHFVRAAAVHPERTLVTRERIQPWKAAGLAVNVWTVNDPEEARTLDALGVDSIITDEPATIIGALGR